MLKLPLDKMILPVSQTNAATHHLRIFPGNHEMFGQTSIFLFPAEIEVVACDVRNCLSVFLRWKSSPISR